MEGGVTATVNSMNAEEQRSRNLRCGRQGVALGGWCGCSSSGLGAGLGDLGALHGVAARVVQGSRGERSVCGRGSARLGSAHGVQGRRARARRCRAASAARGRCWGRASSA
jgi:hypothetical protein